MRIAATILILTAAAAIASPWQMVIARKKANAGSGCSTPTFADVFNIGFLADDDPDAVSGWTTTNDASTDYDYDTSGLTTNRPDTPTANPCEEGARVDFTDGGGGTGENWFSFDAGSGIANWTMALTFYVQEMGSGDFVYIVSAGSSATPGSGVTFRLELYNSAGTLQIKCVGLGGNTGYDALQSGWNTLVVEYDKNAATCEGMLNGVSVGTFTGYNVDTRYWHFGAPELVGANDDLDLVFGDIHLENDDA